MSASKSPQKWSWKMSENNKDKTARAREIDAAIREHDAKRAADANLDLGTERASGSSGGELLDKLLSKLDDCVSKMVAMSKRMDEMENTHRHKDDDDLEETEEKRKLREEGEAEREERREMGGARPVVADADVKRRHALADAQARADEVASRFGQRADAPLAGEGLRAYRCRQLRRYQRFSPQYSKSDLDTISDEAVFNGVESKIYSDACLAADSPDSVPAGQLRMVTRLMPSGHRENTFIGSPHAWMDRFGGNRRYVTAFRTKFD
jgi:hypothetical protein